MASDRSTGQILADFAANAFVRLLIGLALALPYAWRVPFVGWVTRHLVAPLAGYKARARANLAMIFPELGTAERDRIADQTCDNAGRTLIENYSTAAFMARMATLPVTGPGLAALETARAGGRPAILVSGHFGNYELAGRCCFLKN